MAVALFKRYEVIQEIIKYIIWSSMETSSILTETQMAQIRWKKLIISDINMKTRENMYNYFNTLFSKIEEVIMYIICN